MTAAPDELDFWTEDQRAEAITQWRLQRALDEAPDLIRHVRAIALSAPEAGETLRQWSAPMRITAADDADAAFAFLVDQTTLFADDLNVSVPAPHMLAWMRAETVRGFAPGTNPENAYALTRLHTVFLSIHAERIAALEFYEQYREDVINELSTLRAKYPLDPRREKPTQARQCEKCGAYAVRAEWAAANRNDVRVYCEVCGNELDPTTPAVLRWIRDAA